MKQKITLTVNGTKVELYVEANNTLLDVLRNELNLLSVREGCGSGECGACTVLLNNEPVPSCLVLAPDADGAEITTAEGLASGEKLHSVIDAFVRLGAIQCGFCSPGMLLSAKALLDKNPHPTEEEIRQGLEGNICRCTGYVKILDAVRSLSKR